MQVDILKMLDHDRYGLAAAYAGSSIVAGFAAIWIATAVTRRVRMIA